MTLKDRQIHTLASWHNLDWAVLTWKLPSTWVVQQMIDASWLIDWLIDIECWSLVFIQSSYKSHWSCFKWMPIEWKLSWKLIMFRWLMNPLILLHWLAFGPDFNFVLMLVYWVVSDCLNVCWMFAECLCGEMVLMVHLIQFNTSYHSPSLIPISRVMMIV